MYRGLVLHFPSAVLLDGYNAAMHKRGKLKMSTKADAAGCVITMDNIQQREMLNGLKVQWIVAHLFH